MDTLQNSALGNLASIRLSMKSLLSYGPDYTRDVLDDLNQLNNNMRILYIIDTNIIDNPIIDSNWVFYNSLRLELIQKRRMQDSVRVFKKNTFLSQLNTLLQTNSNINTTNLPESNEKIVNQIILNQLYQGYLVLNAQDRTTLINIASQCPLEGGDAVYRARGIIQFLDNTEYNDTILCSPSTFNNANNRSVASDKIYIISDSQQKNVLLNIQNFDINEQYVFKIYDALGRLQLNYHISNPIESIDLNYFNRGIYFIHLQNNNGESMNSSILIYK